MASEFTRRHFLTGAAAAVSGAVLGGGCRRQTKTCVGPIPGTIVGANSAGGHLLRTGVPTSPGEYIETDVVVVGGGIAGLAAARKLHRLGCKDLLLFELENALGGNSLSGRNEVSAFPWGAHYLPLPNEESTEVIQLLEEIGLVQGRDANGAPIYDEYALCADPMERLFVNGTWQEGVLPRLDLAPSEHQEIEAFLAEMDRWRDRRGADQKRCFAIPVDRSSSDETSRELDRITMAEYLDRQGWRSEPLRWYVNYCCRDDYGAGIEVVSAWAGIHYFAGRSARAANAAPHVVLTWPSGNGFLVDKLSEGLGDRMRPGHLATRLSHASDGAIELDVLELATRRLKRVRAKMAVCALPRFVANRIIPELSAARGPATAPLEYSPWLVANLTLSRLPQSNAEVAWDNVLRKSPSLGYVVATHQQISRVSPKSVITYYRPLDQLAPRAAREAALKKSHAEWCDDILADLSSAHRDLPDLVETVDLWIWGHAMARPLPGFITGEARTRMLNPVGKIFFAHSDMSGVSLFEEAYTRGVEAAVQIQSLLRPIRV